MTTARSLLVDSEFAGYYHCMSRCVRRAWLCGVDPHDWKSYEHRREWVEARLLELADIFAVGIYAYAVMSNHVHVVVAMDPGAAAVWSPEDVASRCFAGGIDRRVNCGCPSCYFDMIRPAPMSSLNAVGQERFKRAFRRGREANSSTFPDEIHPRELLRATVRLLL